MPLPPVSSFLGEIPLPKAISCPQYIFMAWRPFDVGRVGAYDEQCSVNMRGWSVMVPRVMAFVVGVAEVLW